MLLLRRARTRSAGVSELNSVVEIHRLSEQRILQRVHDDDDDADALANVVDEHADSAFANDVVDTLDTIGGTASFVASPTPTFPVRVACCYACV